MAAELHLVLGPPGVGPHRRVEAHRFLNHLLEIGDAGEVGGSGGSTVQARRQLLGEPRLDGGVRVEQIQGPGQGVGGGLVPGEQQGHHLVAHLRLVHPFAGLLVARGEQAIEEVAFARAGAPPSVDHRVHDAVQTLLRAFPLEVVGGRDPRVEGHERAELLRSQVDDLQDPRDFFGMAFDIASEKGRADDPESEPVHLAVDMEGLAVRSSLPIVHHRGRERVDRLVEAVDVAVREHRLHQPSLLHPVRPVVRHEAVSHHLCEHEVVDGALGEALVALGEDRAQVVRMVDEVDIDETAPAHEVAVLPEQVVHAEVRRRVDAPEPVEPGRRGRVAEGGGCGGDHRASHPVIGVRTLSQMLKSRLPRRRLSFTFSP